MKKVLLALLAGLFIFTACETEDSSKKTENQEETLNIPEYATFNSEDYIKINFRIEFVNVPDLEGLPYSAIAENIYSENRLIICDEITPSIYTLTNYFIPRNENINATLTLVHNLPISEDGKDAPVINLKDYLDYNYWREVDTVVFTFSYVRGSFHGLGIEEENLNQPNPTRMYIPF